MPNALPNDLYEELGSAIRGELYQRDDPSFGDYSTIFNGNVTTDAKAVACPLDADDVSRIVRFCNKHGLSLSVKAGGYGTAGWAIGGDIIVDVSKIDDLDIEAPHEDGSFTSLRDVASAHSKGKKAVTSLAASSGKRRREEDANLRVYDAASFNVASFLRGQPLVIRDGPSPANRRRLVDPPLAPQSADQEQYPLPQDVVMSSNVDSVSGSGSPSGGSPDQSTQPLSPRDHSDATLDTSPSPPGPGAGDSIPSMLIGNTFGFGLGPAPAPSARDADPFGYLNEPTADSDQAPFSNFPPSSTTSIVADWRAAVNEGSPDGDHDRLDVPSRIEPIHPHAFVTFGAGKRQKEIDTYTAQNRLEAVGTDEGVPYHVPFSAHPVGSSIMLLGGFGFMSRLRGLSIDNLVEVEMVLADGRIVVISENEHPDLWWALRGAGPAFGIATRYKAKAFPVPVVFAGNLIYRFNRTTAPSLIKHFRDCVKGAPRELYANLILTAGPPGKDSLVVIQFCYIGPREKGQEYLAAISSWDGEKCLLSEVDEKSFLHQQDSVAQVLRGKAGRQWYIRSTLVSSLPDDIVNDTVNQFADTPVGCTWLFELAGGAIADFEDSCVPKSQREAPWTVAALHQWEMSIDDDRCVDSAEEWIAGTLKPVHIGGPFPSFLGRHEPPERTKACFGSSWDRLCEIKTLYDPTNVFRHSLWPLNAQGELVEPETHEPPTPEDLWTSLRGPRARAKAKARKAAKAAKLANAEPPAIAVGNEGGTSQA